MIFFSAAVGHYETLHDDKWHFICTTWRNSDGRSQIYVDGALIGTGSAKANTFMEKGKQLVIGQEVDAGLWPYDQKQSFKGKITGWNFYDRVLTAEEINNLLQYCYHSGGNLWKWSDIKMGGLQGSAQVSSDKPSCLGF